MRKIWQVNPKLKPLYIMVIMIITASFSACGDMSAPEITDTSTLLPPTSTNTSIPPSLTSSPIPPTETSSPVPPTCTPSTPPTATPIPGSTTPFMVDDLEIHILDAGLGENYGGFIPGGMGSGDIVLWLELELLSGEVDTLIDLMDHIEDENGISRESGAVTTTGSMINDEFVVKQINILFPVPENSNHFILYFSSGEAVDLTPLLQ